MPSYSFVCEECDTRFARQIAYSDYETVRVECPKCGSGQVRRRIGRPRMLRSAETRFGDADNLDEMPDDPKAMAGMMRAMGDEAGEDLGPEFSEVVDRLEKGQNPEDIERELPELGMGDDMNLGD
ncbi:MAG: zinc ribbon domain-containing protein [Anaerolineales bacterium]